MDALHKNGILQLTNAYEAANAVCCLLSYGQPTRTGGTIRVPALVEISDERRHRCLPALQRRVDLRCIATRSVGNRGSCSGKYHCSNDQNHSPHLLRRPMCRGERRSLHCETQCTVVISLENGAACVVRIKPEELDDAGTVG